MFQKGSCSLEMLSPACTGIVTNLFPSSFSASPQWSHTLQCTRVEQPQHHSCTPCPGLCCLHPENTCSTPHQQSKRPEATGWVHFPSIFIAAAVPCCVAALRNLISAVLSWQEQSKIWTEMETQFWGSHNQPFLVLKCLSQLYDELEKIFFNYHNMEEQVNNAK